LSQLNSRFNNQIDDKTQPYKCNELTNVFKNDSVDIVSAISLDR